MSILQEYEETRAILGKDMYDAISKYLDKVSPPQKYDDYMKELDRYKELKGQQYIDKLEELKKKHGVILLSDVLNKYEEWEKYEKWYYEDYKKLSAEILSAWVSDYDDIRYNAILYRNNKPVANIIGDCYYPAWKDELNNLPKFKKLVYSGYERFLKLPKASKCSSLLQEIYDTVCESDNSMCYITDEDWKELYADRYTEKDIERLKQEVKKYKLDKYITFDEDEYKILGYGDLEMCLNDDRKINKEKDYER